MVMSSKAYSENVIKNIPFTELLAEYREKFKYGQELEDAMNQAYRDGDVNQMFRLAAELGIISVQIQIIQREVGRRDEEEPPLSPKELSEAEAMLFEELIDTLFR